MWRPVAELFCFRNDWAPGGKLSFCPIIVLAGVKRGRGMP
jgi:hypothetical protein